MPKNEVTRDNHYVPIWYQKGFLKENAEKLRYLDLKPDQITLPNGQTKHHRELFESYPSQCFYSTDLYTTFFGKQVNDEIEKRLFGSLDTRGSKAVRAFLENDPSAWHNHFEALFIYLDAQKLRTPKGLDWIRGQYPSLSQNELMDEMQGIRTINCTIWSESVREIVSASAANVKFIITDHPVTTYNFGCGQTHRFNKYPNDPSITLKATQTVFPLNQDQCLILTNLEYAKNPKTTAPEVERTFARQVRQSLVRTDKFIKTRSFNDTEVIAVNYVLKSRAKRFLAAGCKEWLWPEKSFVGDWADAADTLLPPDDELWQFGGETFVRYEDGSVHFQDEYGRTTPQSTYLNKTVDERDLKANDQCGCGYGKKFKYCCKNKPVSKRPSWKTLSIRERNLGFFRGVNAILGTDSGKNWNDVRRELDEEKVKKIHELYGYTWPADTNIFDLLPKPDGNARALFSGIIDPRTTPLVVSNASLYFGDILVQNPFINPNQVREEFSPVERPQSFILQTLRNLFFFFQIVPLIENGRVNLFPDPASIDTNLQSYSMSLAEERSAGISLANRDIQILERIREQDFQQALSMLPKDAIERMVRDADPDAPDEYVQYFMDNLDELRKDNPLVSLREAVLDQNRGGQYTSFQMAPNFELMLLMAQSTGAHIVTDSHHRWGELLKASHREMGLVVSRAPKIPDFLSKSILPICDDLQSMVEFLGSGNAVRLRLWMDRIVKELTETKTRSLDADALSGFDVSLETTRKQLGKNASKNLGLKLGLLAPQGGIYHNHVLRLMVRLGIKNRTDRVMLAILMDIEEIQGETNQEQIIC